MTYYEFSLELSDEFTKSILLLHTTQQLSDKTTFLLLRIIVFNVYYFYKANFIILNGEKQRFIEDINII